MKFTFSLTASALLLHHVNHNVAGVNIYRAPQPTHNATHHSYFWLIRFWFVLSSLCSVLLKVHPQQAPFSLLHKVWCFKWWVKMCSSHSAIFFVLFGFPWEKKDFNYIFTANESLLHRHSFTCSRYFKTHVHGHLTHTHCYFFPLLEPPCSVCSDFF